MKYLSGVPNILQVPKTLAFLLVLLFFTWILPFSAPAQAAANISGVAAVDSMVSSSGEAVFRILIKNDDSQAHKYSLSCGLLPKGMQADFNLNGSIISELKVKAGGSDIAGLIIKIPEQAPEGTTIIDIEVKRDDGQTSKLPVSVTVNRAYSLRITSRVTGLSVITGQDLSFEVSVLNSGSKSIDDIKLSLDLPYKWMLQGTNPGTLSLKPGESGLYKVKVSIPLSQTSGNSTIKAYAVSTNATSPKVEIPVSVQNNPDFLFWVIGIIAVAGIGTLLYFRKHGRR